MRSRWPSLGAALFGLAWFVQIGGAAVLNPSYTTWIGPSDWMQHWLGWLMFRHSGWSFPFGTITGVPYPVGTTTAFMDANPLVSLLLKPFSPRLPTEFQFIGPWLALCFVLQGYFGALLASTVTADRRQQLLGGLLFVLSPVLFARMGHDTLCAHWLLLLVLYLGLREYPSAGSALRGAGVAAGAAMLAAAIHPYLTVMVWLLAQACYGRLWRAGLMTARQMAAAVAVSTVGVLAVFGTFGYLGGEALAVGGFGIYSADVLTLFDPRDYSRLLPPVPGLANETWEGFGYLGLGGLLACVVALVVFARQRPRLRAGIWVVLVVVVLMALYAFSVNVRIAGTTVITSKRLYSLFVRVTASFRSSGRFIWPLHYLALLFGIWGVVRVTKWRRTAVASTLLAAAVVLQAAELKVDRAWSAPKKFRRANVQEFALARGKYDHLALYPMQVVGACGARLDEPRMYRYLLLAYQLDMSFNSGSFARVPASRIVPICTGLDKAVNTGRLDTHTVYVVEPVWVPTFRQGGAACARIDGDWFCVSRDGDAGFRGYLEAQAAAHEARLKQLAAAGR